MEVVYFLLFLQAAVSSASTANSASNGIWREAPVVPWCGRADNGYHCVGRHSGVITVPCGELSDQNELSFTYYDQHTQKVLLRDSTRYLQWRPQWNDSGVRICCAPNITISIADIPCYQMIILHEPRIVPMKWPAGVSKQPIPGVPFQLHCPLRSNPPAQYTWTRYQSIDRRIQLNFSGDVEFSSDGSSWRVTVYSKDHNGLYECHASNEMGVASYRNDALFFLKPDVCYRDTTRNSTVTVSPPSPPHTLGDNVSLTCTVHSPHTYGLRPFWFVIRNHTEELCVPPLCDRQHPRWDPDSCTWQSVLVLRGLSLEQTGEYVCRYGNQEATATLEVKDTEAPTNRHTLVASVGVLTTVVGLALSVATAHRINRPFFSRSREPSWSGFKYDLFISAHDETRSLVEQTLLCPLETQSHTPYRVCWHLRDFIAGVSIAEQIAEAVNCSRKVLFVFSEHFTESRFCQMELELAMNRFIRTNTRCLVPMAINEGAVPQSVRRMITYLPVVSLSEENLLDSLRQLIGEPISQGPRSAKT